MKSRWPPAKQVREEEVVKVRVGLKTKLRFTTLKERPRLLLVMEFSL